MCSQEGILALRMKSTWSFISYLGRAQPPLSIVLLFLSRSISPQGMNRQLLYPLGGGGIYLLKCDSTGKTERGGREHGGPEEGCPKDT